MFEFQLVNQRAKDLGYSFKIYPSSQKNKRYMAIINGKRVHFGDIRYDNFLTHKDERRRANFHKRFKNNPGYDTPLSPLWLSANLLW
jgi:hypothetical protein